MSKPGNPATPPPPTVAGGIRLEQHARYDYSGPVTNLHQRLVLVPRATHGPQRRSGWRLAVEGVNDFHTRAGTDQFGNIVVEVTVPRVASWVQFSLWCDVRTQAAAVSHRVRPDGRYLSDTRLTACDDRIAGLADGRVDAATLSARVHASFTYQWGVTDVRTTAAEALAGGRGVCQDYAHVMLAACRRAGFPARYVSGHLLGEGGTHAWVEVLAPDRHGPATWRVEAWDPTHDRRAGPGYVTVAVGRDYADVAPLSGTFNGDGVSSALTTRKRSVRLP